MLNPTRKFPWSAGLFLLVIMTDSVSASTTAASPAQIQIEAALTALRQRPNDLKSLNSLAVGYVRRARETGDTRFYEEGRLALEKAQRAAPGNRESWRISAWIAMGRHEFSTAYAITLEYDRRYADDPWNLSVMGDSLMELGRYEQAGRAYQRMVDLKPGPGAYSRVAYFREVTGDLEGARAMMGLALAATDFREREDRAWLQVQIAHLEEVRGNLDRAEAEYRDALDSFPGYHYALAALAELTLRQGRAAESVTLAEQAIAAAPHAERYLLLADALRHLGRSTAAEEAENTFERLATANVDQPDNENHDLVLFRLEQRGDAPGALAVARRESARRRDVHTLDRFAMALAANGEVRKARKIMKRVLEIGTRDPLIARHAESLGLLDRSARGRAGGRDHRGA